MHSPVSIVIPVYNREATLRRTLDSIAGQHLKPARVILVDNNSTDESMRIMNEWASEQTPSLDVRVLTEPKQGAAAARNRGLKEVETDFVMFFDSDDVMLPDHVKDFTDAILANSDVDIFGRDVIYEGLDGKRCRRYFSAADPLFNHLFRATLSTLRYVVRKSLLEAAGGWGENFPGWDDYELGVRLLLQNPRLLQLKGEPSVLVHMTEVSITGTDFSSSPKKWEDTLNAVEKSLRDAGRSDMIKWIEARRMILAAQYKREATGSSDSDYRHNALRQSKRLKEEVTGRVKSPWKYNLIFQHNYIFNRLTWVVCKMIL